MSGSLVIHQILNAIYHYSFFIAEGESATALHLVQLLENIKLRYNNVILFSPLYRSDRSFHHYELWGLTNKRGWRYPMWCLPLLGISDAWTVSLTELLYYCWEGDLWWWEWATRQNNIARPHRKHKKYELQDGRSPIYDNPYIKLSRNVFTPISPIYKYILSPYSLGTNNVITKSLSDIYHSTCFFYTDNCRWWEWVTV